MEVLDGPVGSRSTTGPFGRYVEVLVLDHYLEVLARKPGASARCHRVGPGQSRAARSPRSHQRFWDAARRARGDAAGTRALVGVLLAHRTLPAAV